jgi:alpha/beta superfamily hydrolase
MMATWNTTANAQISEIAKELNAQENRDACAAISRWADQNHTGNHQLRIGRFSFEIVVRNDVIERVTYEETR